MGVGMAALGAALHDTRPFTMPSTIIACVFELKSPIVIKIICATEERANFFSDPLGVT